MAKEILSIPEEKLNEVIHIIKLGIKAYQNSNHSKSPKPSETIEMLQKWCDEEKEYLLDNGAEA